MGIRIIVEGDNDILDVDPEHIVQELICRLPRAESVCPLPSQILGSGMFDARRNEYQPHRNDHP
jgi:hypothetical protein